MKKSVKIIVDTKGGDNGESSVVKGVCAAIEKFEELEVVIIGDEAAINEQLDGICVDRARIEVVDSDGEITCYDNPSEALFKKSESSMLKGLRLLAEREDIFGMLSSGSTGVLLAGSMRYVSGKERVRPVLAALLPAIDGSFTCLVDAGATIDCTPQMMHHFALLGADFMKTTYGIEKPRIGLLSNGKESSKGNKLVKETYPILEGDERLNFIGNVEGNTALMGACDVLVCDGFAGNQVLKVTEGTATHIITNVIKYAEREQSADVKKLVKHLMALYDISSLGGGVILGVAKPIIKTRGSASSEAFVNTAEMLLNMANNKSVFDKNRNKL